MTQIIRDPKGQEILLEAQAQNLELQTLNTQGAKESKQDLMIAAIENIGGGSATTATETSVAQNVASVVLKAANVNRKGLFIRNNSQKNNHILYISYSGTATNAAPTALAKGDELIEDNYTGVVSGIWSNAGTGAALIRELV
jgi:hypothetical protein